MPEFSFVLGAPPDPIGDMTATFEFIRAIKRVNPATEVILYTYTPVPHGRCDVRRRRCSGFRFPDDARGMGVGRMAEVTMRRGKGNPWLDGTLRTQIRNFERVLNAYYPTVTDARLTPMRRRVLKSVSAWRYALKLYAAPYELRALQRFMHYQRPETTGF